MKKCKKLKDKFGTEEAFKFFDGTEIHKHFTTLDINRNFYAHNDDWSDDFWKHIQWTKHTEPVSSEYKFGAMERQLQLERLPSVLELAEVSEHVKKSEMELAGLFENIKINKLVISDMHLSF
jgi:hypothetical protein